jgi:hypothetical protein
MTCNTCATCAHIGQLVANSGGFFYHDCRKESERRDDAMPKNAGIEAHFRADFRVRCDFSSCGRYEDRPPLSADALALLVGLAQNGGEQAFEFFSTENRLAESLDKRFLDYQRSDHSANPVVKIYCLTPLGRAEVNRAVQLTESAA